MIPPLYKFRTIDEKDFESDFTLDSLRKSYVYFAKITTLNDPFEMGAYIDQVSDIEAARIEFMERDWSGSPIGERLGVLGKDEQRKYLEERWNNEEWRDGFINALKKEDGFRDDLKESMSIYCASATRTDGLLWAHYASGHRGIAIEIDASIDEVLRNSRKVAYEEEFPIIDVLRDNDEARFRKGILTKAKAWEYEKEHRTVLIDSKEGTQHKVSPSAFVSITFGAKISDRARQQVIEATRPHLTHVRFEQAKLGKKTFSVEFEEYRVEE